MKKVFSNTDDVIHVFAQQTQSEGRNSSRNVFFNNTKIYSYGHHYLLGEFIDKETILINDQGYSVTTRKHISTLSSATRQYKQFYTTQTDLNLVHSEIISLKDKLANARKKELYILPILNLYKSLNEYLEYTKRKTFVSKDKKYKEVKKIFTSLNNNLETYLDAIKLRKQKEVDKAKIKETENIAKFKDHKINWLKSKFDYLRLSIDKTKVETSQGVKIEIKEAKILNALLRAGKNIRGFKIGYYTVISYTNNILKVGCHNIPQSEINLISKYL